jgi:hypothetical protein
VHREKNNNNLEGLSNEIDFQNVDKKWTGLCLTKNFEFLRDFNDFIIQKVYFLRIMPVALA